MSLRVVPPLYEPGDPGPAMPPDIEAVLGGDVVEAPVRSGPSLMSSSDQDVAQEVIRTLKQRYGAEPVFDEGQLWRYDGTGLWEPHAEEETRNLICSWNGVQLVDGNGNGRVKKDGSPVLFAGNQRSAVSATLRVNDLCRKQGFFDTSAIGVMFLDAFVCVTDAGDVVTREPSPDCRARFRIDAPYPKNPLALPDEYIDVMFKAFAGTDDDSVKLAKIALLQEWFGLSLVGRSPNARALFLVGPERSGKSVTAKIGLGVFPPSVRAAMPIKSLDPSGMNSTSAQYYLAQLAGVRINADLDLPGGTFVGGENFKKIVTGEGMMGRHPAGKPFPFTPRASLLFAGESLPSPEDKNRGFFRRWIVIRYHSQVDEKSVVQNYEEKILKNERAIIASWFIQGAAASIKRGRFDIPVQVEDEVNAWISETDPATQFCKQFCEEAPNLPHEKWIRTADLCEKYNAWAIRYGYKAKNAATFGRDLSRNLSKNLMHKGRDNMNRWGYRYVEGGVAAEKVEEKW